MSACVSCDLNAEGDSLPPRERVHVGAGWRVAHGWSSLPGWLIVVAQRHVESIAELDAAEARSLGALLRAASVALHETLGCEKTYVMQFAEAPGHRHVHFHVVPRMPDLAAADVGPGVFRYLSVPEAEQVPAAERDALAQPLGRAIETRLAR